MKRKLVMSGIALALACSPALSMNHSAQSPAPYGWTTVFEDQFDYLDPGIWSKLNGQVAGYFYVPGNAYVSGSNLVLRATKRMSGLEKIYETGGVLTPKKFLRGRISARAKVTDSAGMIPAIWTTSFDSCGEIDVFEAGGIQAPDPKKARFAHYFYINAPGEACIPRVSPLTEYEWTAPASLAADYHVYQTEWSTNAVSYAVDGVTRFTGTERIPDVPMLLSMQLNLEYGNDFPNQITDASVFPSDFLIDWIKVEQWAPITCTDANPYTGEQRNLVGGCVRTIESSINGDARGDIVLINRGTSEIALGYGTESAGLSVVGIGTLPMSAGSRVAQADFNKDGYSDVAYFNPGSGLQIFYGHASNGYRNSASIGDTWGDVAQLIPGDFNGDGYSDLFVYAKSGANEVLYGQVSAGLRTTPASRSAWNGGLKLAPGDFNGDGYTDLFLYNANGTVEVRYGQVYDGLRFAPGSQDAWSVGHTLVPGDFNGDQYTDLLVYARWGAVEIRYGQIYDGLRFAPGSAMTWNQGHALVPGDFNGDGATDVFVYGANGSIEIRYGQAADGLRFSSATQAFFLPGHKLASSDFNGDGFSDLLVYGSSGQSEIRFGQPQDGLRFAANTQAQWNSGWELSTSYQKQF